MEVGKKGEKKYLSKKRKTHTHILFPMNLLSVYAFLVVSVVDVGIINGMKAFLRVDSFI